MLYSSYLLALLPLVLAAPVAHERRALTVTSYNDLSISAGTAGTAKAEADAKFPFTSDQFATVSAADLKTIQTERESEENAETDAFNPAIAAAAGDAATALQNGKIKNKVLKLVWEVNGLLIEQAQGKDVSDDLATEQGKLNNNIALDQKAAGQASTAVSFSG